MTKNLVILLGVLILAVASCGGSDSGSDDDGGNDAPPVEVGPPNAANGENVYDTTCIACHGQNGEGISGLGKPMPGSEFIEGLSDEALGTFIKEGRGADHPDNTTGVEMPAWGGNTNLTEQDIVDVVAYIRTL